LKGDEHPDQESRWQYEQARWRLRDALREEHRGEKALGAA
jgi:hypothetical protein